MLYCNAFWHKHFLNFWEVELIDFNMKKKSCVLQSQTGKRVHLAFRGVEVNDF